jgi:hypothetical protein
MNHDMNILLVEKNKGNGFRFNFAKYKTCLMRVLQICKFYPDIWATKTNDIIYW